MICHKPIKDLIDWDQRRLDAEGKFEQVSEQFAIGGQSAKGAPTPAPSLSGITAEITPGNEISVNGLGVIGSAGDRLLDRVSVALPLGQHIALIGKVGEGAATLAQVLGGRITVYSGSVSVPGETAGSGSKLAYVGPEAVIFDATLRDNMLYGLRQSGKPNATGQSLAMDSATFEARLLDILRIVGLDEMVFGFGLARPLDPQASKELALRIYELRTNIREKLAAAGVADAVEPYDPTRFIKNASIGENILFGWPSGEAFTGESLSQHAFTRQILTQSGLMEPLTELGRRIAVTMLEIFEGLPPDHILFEQFGFFSAERFPEFRELLSRYEMGGLSEADRSRLLGAGDAVCRAAPPPRADRSDA